MEHETTQNLITTGERVGRPWTRRRRPPPTRAGERLESTGGGRARQSESAPSRRRPVRHIRRLRPQAGKVQARKCPKPGRRLGGRQLVKSLGRADQPAGRQAERQGRMSCRGSRSLRPHGVLSSSGGHLVASCAEILERQGRVSCGRPRAAGPCRVMARIKSLLAVRRVGVVRSGRAEFLPVVMVGVARSAWRAREVHHAPDGAEARKLAVREGSAQGLLKIGQSGVQRRQEWPRLRCDRVPPSEPHLGVRRTIIGIDEVQRAYTCSAYKRKHGEERVPIAGIHVDLDELAVRPPVLVNAPAPPPARSSVQEPAAKE